ncbi:MAG: hypothetical protein CVV42_08110 [Candidatus Riflebacteria bacterium HGW-Riflebacteria-2]|jgi:hypothetical protein|nr:MAG: hypothetical protein CVV42_08110 [Candidatus Riflebacteria bacterium HGW-Riflebacteria-2]
MKKEHLEIVWDSCSELEKSTISFGEFLEKIGRTLESANLREARFIGEIARNLELAMFSGTYEDIEKILDHTKRRISQKIRVTD